MSEPIDIVMLTHNRGDHLARTVEALHQHTPEPYRLIVVDNASEPDVRNWLWEHRDWFHRLLLRPTNDYVPAFQHGIAVTTSDPYVVTDPDLLVPEIEPSWLARLLGLMEQHPDFGMIALDVDMANQPAHFTPEWVDAFRGNPRKVSDDLMEGNVGGVFAAIRRGALRDPYTSDVEACDSVRRAGYRVGWTPAVKTWHLGWDDLGLYPEYLAAKTRDQGAGLPHYGDPTTLLERRPPRLRELALSAPMFALTRSAGVADPAVLEVAWDEPALGAAQDEVMTLHAPPGARLPLDDGAAGAVVLSDPPRDSLPELIHEAKRVATSAIVLSVDLPAVAGRMASELAPDGWVGQEHRGVGKHVLEWADASDRRAEIAAELGLSGIQDRDGWLALFAAGTFGETHRRLFAFFPEAPEDPPDSVRVDAQRVERWRPPPPDPRPSEERRGALRRALGWVWR